MSEFVKVGFGPLAGPEGGTYVVLVGDDLKCAPDVEAFLGDSTALIARAAAAAKFKGKALTSLDILAPHGVVADRLLVIGVGAATAAAETSWTALGGYAFGKLGGAPKAGIAFSPPHGAGAPGVAAAAADFMLGMRLRAFRFDLYKTKKKDDDAPEPPDITIGVTEVAAARKAAKSREAIAGGVEIARALINEPPNVLFPEEFAERAAKLSRVGVEIDILDEKRMAKLGMGSLLGVGQGSPRDSRMVVMRWNGAKDPKAPPVAFIGKGVCFDTGGISIKSAGGMEDMKGDMAGAACVVGLMHALASRKAKVNAIGAIGLVENMPDGNAMRPGDILTSMSGQTIEIINTDAEGRLVLADVLWYIQDKYKPVFMVDLATLTGAILVALGHEYAGLFSNNDELSARLLEAGKTTGEKVWRMPMDPAFDKMIDSKFADVKNAGGRHGGSSSAAHFLRRFVNETPWAHLDIAGVGMASPATETNQGWASGWGVALLDRLVADHYEQ